jgi:hypothetical protein
MSNVECCTIDETTQVDGALVRPVAVELTYEVGKYGLLSVTHHQGPTAEDSAKLLSSPDVAIDMGNKQAAMFKQREAPDVTMQLSVTGGSASYKANFSGYLANSKHSFSAGSCGRSDQALDEIAIIDAFDCTVYNNPTIDRQNGKIPLKECDYNLAKLIKWVIQECMKAGTLTSQVETTLSKKSKQEQSKINDKLWPTIDKLLTDSVDTIGWVEEFKGTAGTLPVLSQALCTTILAAVKTTGGSFIGVLLSLCEHFQLLFIPDITADGTVTYRLVNKAKVFENPEQLLVPVVSASMTAGSLASLFPVKYVAAISANMNAERQSLPFQSYVVYPESRVTEGSTAVKVTAPTWLTSINVYGKIDIKGEPKKETKLQGSASEEDVTRQEMTEQEATEANNEILKNWAKVIYQDIALGDASVTLTAPLLRNISPGKCYKVCNMKGENLFTGFCSTVTARVVSQGSRQATLTAVFSHVEMGNFSLPEK